MSRVTKSSIQELLETLETTKFESHLNGMRSISDIDRECKEIWPDWNPQENTASDSYIFKEYNFPKDMGVRFATDINQEVQFDQNKNIFLQNPKKCCSLQKRKIQRIKTDDKFDGNTLLINNDERNKGITKSQPSFGIQIEEKIHSRGDKDEIKKNIIFLSRLVNKIKKENTDLESEYENLKRQLEKSRLNCQKLTKKLRESEDIYRKMEVMHENYRKINFADPNYIDSI